MKHFNSTIRVYRYGILGLAFVCGCIFASFTAKAETVVATNACDVCVVASPVMVRSVAPWRPRAVVTTVQKTEVTTTAPMVRSARIRPALTFEQSPAPAYSVVETPRAPFVWNGLFRDRVVVPRRTDLTVVPVQ